MLPKLCTTLALSLLLYVTSLPQHVAAGPATAMTGSKLFALNPPSTGTAKTTTIVTSTIASTTASQLPSPTSLIDTIKALHIHRRKMGAQRPSSGHSDHHHHSSSKKHASKEPRSKISLAIPDVIQTGIIRVHTSHGQRDLLGYVSSLYNGIGGATITSNAQDAMRVSVPISTDRTQTVEVTILVGPNNPYPFLGGIVAHASSSPDLRKGNSNYAYIGSTESNPNTTPQGGGSSFAASTGTFPGPIESSIWLYNPVDRSMVPQWTNTDKSFQRDYIGYVKDELLFTADPTAFQRTGGSTTFVNFTLVPA